MNSTQAFTNNLKTLLENRGISSKEAARRLGISNSTLSRYLNGLRQPDVTYLVKIAIYFDVSTDWLLGLSDSRMTHYPDDLTKFYDKYMSLPKSDRAIINAVMSRYEDTDDNVPD